MGGDERTAAAHCQTAGHYTDLNKYPYEVSGGAKNKGQRLPGP